MRFLRKAAILTLFLSTPAAAHTGQEEVAGFLAGFMHPFSGMDHLLAMTAVGLWAASLTPRQAWKLPLAFVLVMLVGGGLGALDVPLPGNETGIALSVLALGALIATRSRLSQLAAISLTAFFALFHGYAHGQEIHPRMDFSGYALGFSGATLLLHLVGILLGHALLCVPGLYRAVGIATGMAGGFLIAQTF